MKSSSTEQKSSGRFGIRPDDVRAIVSSLQKNGHMTDAELFTTAKKYECSQEAIRKVVEENGFQVLSAFRVDGAPQDAPSPQGAFDGMEILDMDDDGEEADLSMDFGSPKEEETVSPSSGEKRRKGTLSASPTSAMAEQFARELSLKKTIERMQLEAEKKQLAFDTEIAQARAAVAQTKKLRIATRADRERIEELEGYLTVLQSKLQSMGQQDEKVVETNFQLRAELRASMARESRLIEALEKSEADLAAARQQPAEARSA